MNLKWETFDTGLGWKRHVAGDYVCEPEDLDIRLWEAFYAGESLGFGTWQQCRGICQAHSEATQTPRCRKESGE